MWIYWQCFCKSEDISNPPTQPNLRIALDSNSDRQVFDPIISIHHKHLSYLRLSRYLISSQVVERKHPQTRAQSSIESINCWCITAWRTIWLIAMRKQLEIIENSYPNWQVLNRPNWRATLRDSAWPSSEEVAISLISEWDISVELQSYFSTDLRFLALLANLV